MKLRKPILCRMTAMLLTLVCVLGLFPATALAAAPDTIQLERFGMSGVSYESASLGKCTLHQMYYSANGTSVVGFCGEKGKSMGNSLIGQTWGNRKAVTDSSVSLMMAYYYAHSTGVFTDQAEALGVNTIWDAGYTWYMNAWVQAFVWRYKEGSLGDPVVAAAEELMAVFNVLDGAHYSSIDEEKDGTSFRDRTQYIFDLGNQGVWGDCKVYEYTFTGAGSATHPAGGVQSVMLGELEIGGTEETYTLIVKKVDATNPSKGLPGAKFHIEAINGSFSKDIVTGFDGTYKLDGLAANTYAVTEVSAPNGYKIDNAGPEYVVLPNNGSITATVTFTDTPVVTASGSIRKVDADDPTHGLAGAVIKIEGVDNGFTGTYTTGTGGALTGVPWDTMPIGSYTATEVTAPEGYTLSSDPDKVKQTFYWDGKNEVSLVFENDAKVKVRLLKTDEAGKPLSGAVFHILKDGQIIGSEATKADGSITVSNVTEGLYAFVEVSAPENYARLQEPVIAHVDQSVVNGGGTVTVTAKNQKLPTLTIQKRDAQTTEVIPGTVFEVKGIHFGYHADVTTGASGKAVLSHIPVDSYEVTEKSVPDPYVVGEESTQTIYLGPGADQQLIFENLKQPLLTISKTDADTGEAISGTVFTVEGIDSDYKVDWTTEEDGTVSKRVAPGSYKITEKSVPAPYYLPSKNADREQTVSLNAGDEKTVNFKNHRMPELTIYKEDSVAGAPVEGAKFHITYTSNGDAANAHASKDYGYFLTDSKGEIRLHEQGQKLYPGTYTVTEVEPAPGFQMKEPSTQTVSIKGSESKTVTFQNVPLNAIIVEKYDSVTHEALPGCSFVLRYLGGTSGTGGTVIGQKVTGKNGAAIWTDLTAGTYILEEVDPADGYSIIQSSETIYLADSGEQSVITVRFENTPDGILLIRKVCSVNPSVTLRNAEFKVTYADGTLIGDSNGIFVTDENGEIRIPGLKPGKSVIVTETKAPDGYLIDTQSQTIQIKEGRTVTLTFKNQPKGALIIQKRDSVTDQPLSGAEFRITTAVGCEVGLDGVIGDSTLTQNGIFTTDANGEIKITNLAPGAYVLTEIKAPAGYVMDSPSTNVVIGSNGDTQTVVIKNTPSGGLLIIKSDEDTGKRISGVQFEVRKMNGEIIGTYTTDRNGTIQLPELESGWYTVTELKAASGYLLDSTPQQVEVKDGQTATLELTNHKSSKILLHKVDKTTGEGIYGATFLLYDSNKNPIGEYTTDQDGYIYMDEDLEDGRYYLREIKAADGYVLDPELKTIYVHYGSTTEIEWTNTAECGQIQLIKKSADYNSINGLPAGTLLEGAVFEIYDKAGNTVDTIKTDKNGRAVSKTLPLSRYTIREVTAPNYYAVNPTVMTAYLEHSGQIVTFEVEDESISTGISIKKTGPVQAVSGQPIRYVFSQIKNTSTVSLNSFYWRDTLPTQVTLNKIVTGSYNQQLSYKVVYKTNLSTDYRTLADNLSTSRVYVLDARPAVLGLAANERITEVMFVFGTVKAGFAQVETPYFYTTARSGLANNSSIVNVADVGGLYNGQWIQAVSRWLTTVYAQTVTTLPKTGY